MKSHTSKQARAFFCEMCGLKFDKRHLMNRHVKIKHTVKERRYKCSHQDCDKGESWVPNKTLVPIMALVSMQGMKNSELRVKLLNFLILLAFFTISALKKHVESHSEKGIYNDFWKYQGMETQDQFLFQMEIIYYYCNFSELILSFHVFSNAFKGSKIYFQSPSRNAMRVLWKALLMPQ